MQRVRSLSSHADVQPITRVPRVRNVLKATAVPIHWLASIWVNVGRVDRFATNDRIIAIVTRANVPYVSIFDRSAHSKHGSHRRIAKAIAKVIDANDAVQDLFSMVV
jgi:isopentenyl diphosphate isomerase/L-lactate dehydrogenase-like FMN-dependent dehydrogenase